MDKVYMNKQHGISFCYMQRDDNFYLRVCPILYNTEENLIFKVDYRNGIAECKTDYFCTYTFTKSQIKAIQNCVIKAMKENPEIITMFKKAFKTIFYDVTNILLKERNANQTNIALLFNTFFYDLFIREV